MKRAILTLASALCVILAASAQQLPVYLNDSKPIEERVEDALRRMTLEEKVAMCHAQSKFSSAGVKRLGIPENWTTDGPHGIRPEVLWDEWKQAGWTNDSCTAYPALTCLAATWDRELSLLYGRSIGEEARYRNKNILLGPGVNIYRTPLNGRNFEYMGEDPYLAGQMVVPYVKGVQQNGVAVCVKHFALNNQETNRHTADVEVDDRTLYEIYLPAFRAAVQQGGAWSIMGSYNKYRGEWCCHNRRLLIDILRGEWGFDGVVVSDWGGAHVTEQAILNGMDMEFGTWTDGLGKNSANAYANYHLATPFLNKLRSGEVPVEVLDAKVRNILRLTFRTTMDRTRPWGSMATPEHFAAARRIAAGGVVLLKNEGAVLPVDFSKKIRVAVIGENAVKMMTVGGGSSSLKTHHETSPLDGIRTRAAAGGAEVLWARGYVGDTTGVYNGVKTGQNLVDNRTEDELIAEAVAVARTADVVLFFGGLNKSKWQDCEGIDRKQLGLPYAQDRLIAELAKVNKRLAVVLISGNAVAMPWVGQVPAVVQGWYLGSETGTALADVISGDVNPSGKLPFTFPVKLDDVGAHSVGDYPGNPAETYREGIFVGYRWAEKHNVKPLFPFGHGLSYTSFRYGPAKVDRAQVAPGGTVTVTVEVTNTGRVAGAEVVQLYVGDPQSSLPRPAKELKGFEKVYLTPGESRTVSFTLGGEELSFFDPEKHAWVAEPGRFDILVGTSSADIRSRVSFELKGK